MTEKHLQITHKNYIIFFFFVRIRTDILKCIILIADFASNFDDFFSNQIIHLFYFLFLLEYCEGPLNSINSQENYCGVASTQGRLNLSVYTV
jgi:hypothetical protein